MGIKVLRCRFCEGSSGELETDNKTGSPLDYRGWRSYQKPNSEEKPTYICPKCYFLIKEILNDVLIERANKNV